MSIESDYVKTFTKDESDEIFRESIKTFEKQWNLEQLNISVKILKILEYSTNSLNQNDLILKTFKYSLLKILEKNKDVQFNDVFSPYKNSKEHYIINGMIVV